MIEHDGENSDDTRDIIINIISNIIIINILGIILSLPCNAQLQFIGHSCVNGNRLHCCFLPEKLNIER